MINPASDIRHPTPNTQHLTPSSSYDFVDIGCSDGKSIRHCMARFGAVRGLGVDIDAAKVAAARAGGYEAVVADALHLDELMPGGRVRFVSLLHVLEHLPSLDAIAALIASASRLAEDFLYLVHPNYEGEAYLGSLGLRQYWWHWTGHKSHPRVADFCAIFDTLGLRQYHIRFLEPIWDSTHASILVTSEGMNQHAFDERIHKPKPRLTFAEPVWRAQEIFVALRPFPAAEWASLVAPI